MEQRVPLNREIHTLRGEERHRYTSGGLANPHIIYGIRAAPKMNLHVAYFTGVERIAVERAIDVVAHRPRHHRPGDCENADQGQQDYPNPLPSPAPLAWLNRVFRWRVG